MARLFTDEDFPQPAVEQLRQLGYDVLNSGKRATQIKHYQMLMFWHSLLLKGAFLSH